MKTPTVWDSNTAKSAGITYSDSSVTYNSSSTAYSSSTTGLDEYGKLPSTWTLVTKTATDWTPNAASEANLYVYDSASHTYDSAVDTYDGVVTNQEFSNQNTPTLWVAA